MNTFTDKIANWLSTEPTLDVEIGKGLTIKVKPASIPVEQFAGLLTNGLKNTLQDSHADVSARVIKEQNPNADELTLKSLQRKSSLAVAEKKLEALYAGQARVATESRGERKTPVESAAYDIGLENIEMKVKGWKSGDKAAWAFITNVAKKLEIVRPPRSKENDVKFAEKVIRAAARLNAATPTTIEEARKRVAETAKRAETMSEDMDALLGLNK